MIRSTKQKFKLVPMIVALGIMAFVSAHNVLAYTSATLPFDPSTADHSLSTTDPSSGGFDLSKRDPVSVTIAIINVILTLLGIGFLILLLYAGFIWIWAKGNEEEINRAKGIIIRSVLGLIIVLATYGISYLTFMLVNTYAK